MLASCSVSGILDCGGEEGGREAGKQAKRTGQRSSVYVTGVYQWVVVYGRAAGVVELRLQSDNRHRQVWLKPLYVESVFTLHWRVNRCLCNCEAARLAVRRNELWIICQLRVDNRFRQPSLWNWRGDGWTFTSLLSIIGSRTRSVLWCVPGPWQFGGIAHLYGASVPPTLHIGTARLAHHDKNKLGW